MTVPTLRTERLTLRAPQRRDARVVTKALNNLAVSRWLAVVPFPYGMTDAEWFIKGCLSGEFTAWFIWADEQFIGTIGLDDSLGYWLAEHAWGKGYATEAAQAVVGHYFASSPADTLSSSYFAGNDASMNVLIKLGFEDCGPTTTSSLAQGKEVPARSMVLHRTRWRALQDG